MIRGKQNEEIIRPVSTIVEQWASLRPHLVQTRNVRKLM